MEEYLEMQAERYVGSKTPDAIKEFNLTLQKAVKKRPEFENLLSSLSAEEIKAHPTLQDLMGLYQVHDTMFANQQQVSLGGFTDEKDEVLFLLSKLEDSMAKTDFMCLQRDVQQLPSVHEAKRLVLDKAKELKKNLANKIFGYLNSEMRAKFLYYNPKNLKKSYQNRPKCWKNAVKI